MCEPMTFENAPGIGVHDKDRVVPCIEKDGVGGFRADAVHAKYLFAKLRRWGAEHGFQRAAVVFAEKAHKGFELAGFLPEIAGGADEAGEFCERRLFNGARTKQPRGAQIGDGARSVGPRSVLHQDRSDDDLERGAARPPALLAMSGEKSIKESGELVSGKKECRRAGGWEPTDRRAISGFRRVKVIGKLRQVPRCGG